MARIVEGPKSNASYNIDLGSFFFEAAEKYGNKLFQIDSDCDASETYESTKCRAIKTAIYMRKEGITSNDIVTICSSNNLNNAIPSIAALYLGAKVANLDPSLSLRDVEHCLKIVPPKIIFTQDSCLKLIEDGVKNVNSNAKIVVIGNSTKYKTLEDIVIFCKEESGFKPIKVDPDQTAIILFSSGTTGLPKGICCSHRALYHVTFNIIKADYLVGDFMLHFTSLYWISAVMILVMVHFNGGCRVLCTKVTPQRIMEVIQKYRVTYTFFSPILTFRMLTVENPEKYDTSSLYSITVAGSAIDDEQLVKTRRLFKHSKVQLSYGMSEVSGIFTIFDYTRDKYMYIRKKGSSGKPIADSSFKVVDIETRKMLSAGEKGELCIKTPGLFSGYYNMDCSDLFDKEGFFKTGDVAYYDDDDCLYVVDRIKEMFKYQSWHIVPTSIEQILMEHPDVMEAVVFGIPHKIDGDHPAACIVLKTGCKTSIEDLHSFLNERVIDRQRLRGGIKILDTIPKTPTGKYPRQKIRELFLSL